MKIKLEESEFVLIPEGHADKMYIANFIKKLRVNGDKTTERHFEANFEYDEYNRLMINRPSGGGFVDIDYLKDTYYEAENEDQPKDGHRHWIAVDEITELRVSYFQN